MNIKIHKKVSKCETLTSTDSEDRSLGLPTPKPFFTKKNTVFNFFCQEVTRIMIILNYTTN